ncbi:flagellin [Selenomonas ruminantium]|uniref:flagellin N-terminal helical domain-containing protein n=1 Tax=Selenomonas ruminantium TaxID=971 RepID=UPI0026F225CD|nr:flagellin [Selenomonas ruminantium]
MAMIINNNSSAQMALGELRKNNSKLDKSSRQAASGVKIGGAGDGASEYSISEKMRVQIRGLEQDIANAQTGTNLIKTAEGGIQEIINNLRCLKELALNAANDHNTDLDRETIQKEVDSRLATIDDIAATTNYNGRLLLNGNYGMPEKNGTVLPNEPTGAATLISAGTYDYNITSDGVYSISSNYHGNINITAKNVKLVPETAGSSLTAVAINTSSGGGTNLWLDDITIHNDNPASDNLYAQLCNVIKFQGSNNTLNICNSVELFGGNCTPQNGTMTNRENSAVVNIGDGLSINGVGSGSSLKVIHTDVGPGNGVASAIGTNNDGGTYGNLTITGLDNIDVGNEYGTGIGAAGATMGTITITAVGEIRTYNGGGTGIGKYNGTCGAINISAQHLYGSCAYTSRGGSIIDHGASSLTVTADYILLGAKPSTASVGSYNINNTTSGTTISGTGTAVLNGTAYNPTGQSYTANTSYLNREVLESFGTNANSNGDGIKLPGLVIHTGTKANQHLRVIINSMDTDTLGIQPLPVNPRDAAVAAISSIDGAIDYSLNENTRMGAYQSRLSYTIDNLVTASENTQASESVIRDADMAKTMMEHAKYNILSQSAQSMLAQANQNSSGVLSLLQ